MSFGLTIAAAFGGAPRTIDDPVPATQNFSAMHA
jgi:hypothetical protein